MQIGPDPQQGWGGPPSTHFFRNLFLLRKGNYKIQKNGKNTYNPSTQE